MHIAQTKHESRSTGGPQYYLHAAPAHVKAFLRERGACPVLLQTPYGIAASPFVAVGRDHKLSAGGKPVPGKVGHDRIQGSQSIGEAIRHWYGMRPGGEFKRIDLEVEIYQDDHFILIPTSIEMRTSKRPIVLERVPSPLSFHRDYQSKFWRKQIDARREKTLVDVEWAAAQILRIVDEHQRVDTAHIHEADLLRAAGALSILGLELGLYVTKGYDCPKTTFHFGALPRYACPVEIKKRSSRFDYQMACYDELPRAVVLCVQHDLVNCPVHVDVVELAALGKYLSA
jgi:hypothetical protein